MPSFWLGIVLILIFAVRLRWLPSFGSGDLQHAVLPVATLAAFQVARLARLVRSEIARGALPGLHPHRLRQGALGAPVLWRHALRNTLVTLVTAAGLDFSILIGGAVVVETVFTYNGLGLQLVESIGGRDYPVVQATVFVVAIVVVLVHFVVDWSYQLLDPRTRGGRRDRSARRRRPGRGDGADLEPAGPGPLPLQLVGRRRHGRAALVAASAAFASQLAPHDPYAQEPRQPRSSRRSGWRAARSPTRSALMAFGRDVLSRLLYGGRVRW